MIEIIINGTVSALLILLFLLDAHSANRALERRIKAQEYSAKDYTRWIEKNENR